MDGATTSSFKRFFICLSISCRCIGGYLYCLTLIGALFVSLISCFRMVVGVSLSPSRWKRSRCCSISSITCFCSSSFRSFVLISVRIRSFLDCESVFT